MALLVLAVAAGLEVEAVHVDHGIRAGSAVEASLVAAVAERFGATFVSKAVTVEPGGDLEARARRARRSVLSPEAMTGHTADDQAETVLINLLRGAGPHGLGAMRPGGTHPILRLRRSETHWLCSELAIDVVDDPSNRDPRFVRNRIRGELLPLMGDIGERDVVPLLNRTGEQARLLADWVDTLAIDIDPTDSSALVDAASPVAAAAIRNWLRDENGHPPSAAEVERVMSVARLDVVGCELSGGRRVRRTGGVLRLED